MKILEQVPIEQILYGRFITYKALEKIVYREFYGSKDSKVNIYIDLYQFLTPPYTLMRIKDFFAISSCILNYCAHLRYFFRTRYRTDTRIILVSTDASYKKATACVPSFNSYYGTKFKNAGQYENAIKDNLNLLETLCPYLNEVYMKHGSVDASVIIKFLIDKVFTDAPNIIISTSQLMYQVPPNVDAYTIVLRQSRKFDEDLSYSYTPLNALHAFAYETRKMVLMYPMNQKLVTMLMILSGLPKLSIKSAVNIKTALNILQTIPPGIEHDYLGLYDAYEKYYMVGPGKKSKSPKLSKEDFKNRYMAIDILYQSLLYEHMPESKQMAFLQRLHDPESLLKINEKFYKNNPIQIEELL